MATPPPETRKDLVDEAANPRDTKIYAEDDSVAMKKSDSLSADIATTPAARGSRNNPSPKNASKSTNLSATITTTDDGSIKGGQLVDDGRDIDELKSITEIEVSNDGTARQDAYRERAPKHITQFNKQFREIESRMKTIELALENCSAKVSKLDNFRSPEPSDKNQDVEPKVKMAIKALTWLEFKPWRVWGWEGQDSTFKNESGLTGRDHEFKHKTSKLRKDAERYAIEVLIEDPVIDLTTWSDGPPSKGTQAHKTVDLDRNGSCKCPVRVRITSRLLLAIIRKSIPLALRRQFPEEESIVFLRPFKLFVLYEEKFRAKLKGLEKKWECTDESSCRHLAVAESAELRNRTEQVADGETAAKNAFNARVRSTEIIDSEPMGTQEPLLRGSGTTDSTSNLENTTKAELPEIKMGETESREALGCLRLLIEFLDTYLKSTLELRREIKLGRARSIAFEDLWHLFDYGQEIRAPSERLQVYRVTAFTGGRDFLSSREDDLPREYRHRHDRSIDRDSSNGEFSLECYSYHSNGKSYGPIRKSFVIRRFKGIRDIDSLAAYPWSLDKRYRADRSLLRHRGEKFIGLSCLERIAHRSYSGLSLDEHAEEVRDIASSRSTGIS